MPVYAGLALLVLLGIAWAASVRWHWAIKVVILLAQPVIAVGLFLAVDTLPERTCGRVLSLIPWEGNAGGGWITLHCLTVGMYGLALHAITLIVFFGVTIGVSRFSSEAKPTSP